MLKMQSYDFYKKVINTQQQYKDKKYRNENIRNILSSINTVIKESSLGKVEHIRTENGTISMLKSLVRVNLLVSFMEIQSIS